jgi:hypothetical protein
VEKIDSIYRILTQYNFRGKIFMSAKRNASLSVLLLSLLSMTACTTLADARLAKGSGVKKTYPQNFDKTWNATVCSFNGLGLSIAGENKEEGYILAQRGMTAFSYGENVAAFVSKVEKNKTQVEVVSKKAMSTNLFAPDWSQDVLSGVSGCLK